MSSGSLSIQPSIAFDWTTCCVCGAIVVIEQNQMHKLRVSGKDFYCPNGHVLAFDPEGSKEKKLERELNATKLRLTTLQQERDYQQREKEKAERKLRRILKNGVCPCCHRSFVNVKFHMEVKHKDYLTKLMQS